MTNHSDGAGTSWEQACEAAEHETDPVRLVQLLTQIEEAVFARLQELGENAPAERDSINKAIVTLRRLQVERLNFPKWETYRV